MEEERKEGKRKDKFVVDVKGCIGSVKPSRFVPDIVKALAQSQGHVASAHN